MRFALRPPRRIAAAAVLLLTLLLPSVAAAEVRLPSIFSDHMVLQRDMELPVWGWADAGEKVTISLGDNKVEATANDKGEFSAKLPAMKSGGEAMQLKVAGSNEVVCNDVLIGEVWIASGQSNMEWRVAQADNSAEEIEASDYPNIRFFQIPHVVSGTPNNDVKAAWQACTPGTVKSKTAVGYFFARKIHQELDVPVGIIDTNWGGTRIEPWTPPAGFAAVEGLKDIEDQIATANANYERDLKGNPDTPPKHALAENQQKPTALYNGMIHPIVPYAIRGALWYQGESNRGEGMQYFTKMDALITGWRQIWNQGDFPFYFVQLAPFKYGGSETALPEIWEAQSYALSIPNTGMAVTVDIGNVGNIHPTNKQEVGRRLALWALANNYGQNDLVYSGPLYQEMTVEQNKIRLTFDHATGGLTTSDGKPPSHFQIAGADGKYVDAQATINGNSIIVWAEGVNEPKSVRYAWNQTAEPNVTNQAGLPASPFRTDRPPLARSVRSSAGQ